VLQILWHNKTFRKCLSSRHPAPCLPGHPCHTRCPIGWHRRRRRKQASNSSNGGSCVYCKLKNLLLEIPSSVTRRKSLVLRKTLAIIYLQNSSSSSTQWMTRLSTSRPFCRGFHADLGDDDLDCWTGVISGRPTIGVDDRVGRVDSSLSSSLSPRKEGWSICKPILHRTQHLGNERAGAERVWSWFDHEAPVLFYYCAVLQRSRGWRFSFSFLFLFLLLVFEDLSFFFLSQKLLEMAQAMTKPLPDGWEKRTTPGGQACYFIDHKIRKRAWIAPPGCDIGVISFVRRNSSFLFLG